jgi:hypothetical protein
MDEALIKKLKIPQVGKIAIIEPPEGFLALIGRSAGGTRAVESEFGCYDYVQMFATCVADVGRLAPIALRAVKTDGLLWLSYPKGTSKIKTDLNRDRGWTVVREAGWEGIALVSVDETWSAMRFRPVGAAEKHRVTPAERRDAKIGPAAPLDTPDDLREALDVNGEAAAFFGNLAPSHKKEYILWIVEAKRPETRLARVQKTIEKLTRGLKRPSDK